MNQPTKPLGLHTTSDNLESLPASQEHDLDRLEHDPHIKQQRSVFDVVEIILKLLYCIFDRRAVAVIDLRPTGQARLNQVTLVVERNLLGQLLDEEGAFGARPDETQF